MAMKKKLLSEALKTTFVNIPTVSGSNSGLFPLNKYYTIPTSQWTQFTKYKLSQLSTTYSLSVLIINTNLYVLLVTDNTNLRVRKVCGSDTIRFLVDADKNAIYIVTPNISPMIGFSCLYGKATFSTTGEEITGEEVIVLES